MLLCMQDQLKESEVLQGRPGIFALLVSFVIHKSVLLVARCWGGGLEIRF